MRRAKPKLIVACVAIGIVITSAVLCTYGGSKNVSKSPFYCRQCQSNEVDAPTGAKTPSTDQLTVSSRCTSLAFSTDSGGQLVEGRHFNFTTDYLTSLGFPIAFPVTDDYVKSMSATYSVNDFVIVTAANSDYFAIAMDAVARAQKYFPGHRIIIYDLEAERTNRATIDKIRGLCNAEYRAFDFDRYPPHVRKLKKYAWKPLIIHEVMKSHRGVFWMDSSVRFNSGNLSAVMQTAQANGGIVLFDATGHSIFAATHFKMYVYLPVDRQLMISAQMFGASAILCFRNKQIYESIIRWWFLCALTDDCIAPTDDLYCSFASGSASRSTYARCHRYDQSALNIFIVDHFSRRQRSSTSGTGSPRPTSSNSSSSSWAAAESLHQMYWVPNVLTVERGIKHRENVYTCSGHNRLAVSAKSYFRINLMQRMGQYLRSFFS